jgi:phosphomannomutase
MLYFAVGNYGYDGGVMITASHNPKEYNGLKIVREKAIPISGDTGMQDIERLVGAGNFKASSSKGKITKKDVLADFAKTVRSYVDVSKIGSLKVVMDAASGMAGMIAPKIFEGTKLEIIPMCFKLDGTFPHHQSNPLLEENRKYLVEKVREEKADLGIAWDGDTDRCFFVDDTGYFVQGDFTTGLLAEQMLKRFPGGMILYDLRASNLRARYYKGARRKVEDVQGWPCVLQTVHER